MKDSIRGNIPFYITNDDVKEILSDAAFYMVEDKTGIHEYKHKIEKFMIHNDNDIIDITIDGNTTHLSMTEFKQRIISFLKEQSSEVQDGYLFYDELYKIDTIDHTCIFSTDAYKMVNYAIKKS